MFEKNLVVKNKTGLHARPAASLASLCGKFKSEIRIYTELWLAFAECNRLLGRNQ